MDNKILGALLSGFITIIVALILVSSLSAQDHDLRTLDTVTNDLATLTNTSCTQITTGCIDVITSLMNTSTTLGSGNYSICKTTTGNNDGLLLAGNSGIYVGSTYNTTYTQSANCRYVADNTSKTLMTLTLLFFVISIMVAGLYFLKKTGLMDLF